MPDRTPANSYGFRLFLAGQAVSYFGDHLYLFAIVWWALIETGRVSAAMAVVLVAAGASVVVAPVAGTVIDRSDRTRLLVWVNASYAAVTLLSGVLMVTDLLSWSWLLVLAFVVSALDQVSTPAAATLPPALVPADRLRSANGTLETWRALTGIAAPVVAGVVAQTGSAVGWLLIADAVTFLINLGCLTALSRYLNGRPETAATVTSIVTVASGLRGQMQSLRAVFTGNPLLLRVLLVTTVANILMAPLGVLVADAMRSYGALAAGLATSSFAAGVLAAARAVRRLDAVRDGAMVIWGLVGIAVGNMLFGLAPGVAVACAGSFVAGAGTVVLIVASRTWFQREVPTSSQGRVFSLRFGISMLVRPVGLLAGGAAAGMVGSSWTVAGIGALASLLAVASSRAIMRAEVPATDRGTDAVGRRPGP